jgi:pimeloyl-ACP methyl ester carboxylesterase
LLRCCRPWPASHPPSAGGIPDEIRADYLACYNGDRFAESMRYVRRYPEELPVLAGLLPQITVPVTIINGRHDRVVPPSTRSSSTSGCLPAAW